MESGPTKNRKTLPKPLDSWEGKRLFFIRVPIEIGHQIAGTLGQPRFT